MTQKDFAFRFRFPSDLQIWWHAEQGKYECRVKTIAKQIDKSMRRKIKLSAPFKRRVGAEHLSDSLGKDEVQPSSPFRFNLLSLAYN